MVVLLISLFAILALVGLQLYHTRFRNGLAAIPGPFTASVSNIWKVWALWQSDMPRYIREAHKTYGPVVRIGPNTVSFACSTALHSIYCSRDAPPKVKLLKPEYSLPLLIANQSQFYDASAPIYQDRVIPQLFSIRDPVHHHALKRSISSLYTKSAVQDFEPKIDRCCMLFVHRLQDLCTLRGGSARIDMALWPHFFALDSLSEINVSRNLGFLQTGTDVGGLIAKSDGIMQMIAIVRLGIRDPGPNRNMKTDMFPFSVLPSSWASALLHGDEANRCEMEAQSCHDGICLLLHSFAGPWA